MSDDQAPPTSPGVDPTLIDMACLDLDDAIAALDGIKLVLVGLASLLRQQAAAARRGGLQ